MTDRKETWGLGNFFLSLAILYAFYIGWAKLFNGQTESGKWYFTLLTLGIFMYFFYLQSQQIKVMTNRPIKEILLAKDMDKLKKAVYLLCYGSGVLVFVGMNIIFFSAFFGGPEWDAWMLNTLHIDAGNDVKSFGDLVIGFMMSVLAGILISVFLFFSFFMGTILSGASFAVALQNWLNGLGFDLVTFFETLFDFILPEGVSYLVVIGQFVFSRMLAGNFPRM